MHVYATPTGAKHILASAQCGHRSKPESNSLGGQKHYETLSKAFNTSHHQGRRMMAFLIVFGFGIMFLTPSAVQYRKRKR